ncbi:MAG TPA: AAA domain-containing protein, partial [Kofleriaceae bacterium]|nr:AAA domain-containing protein [Kofleriaceae bacterium]
LAGFHGAAHHARVAELVELDRAQLGIARARAIARLVERVPKVTKDVADTGEIGLLLHELKKQRRHKPLRALFREIPTLLTRLKPCLLMSPLSVAQYLDPAIGRFDLVVFDEASQIPTADAIGALARGDAAVVVGDSRQLPPTRFFDAGGGADDGPPADDELEELESVLDECVAARLPELRLRWHYRSKHEDLIAFSNDRYYGGSLDVFPAAAARVPELGVSWRRIDGVYDRAGTRTNRTEAEAVVAELKYRLLDPERSKRSIAVVTFSRPQQELILDLLDDARREHPELEAFFADGAAEPVIVKNLETIQGDERDVVLFSIGYGPDRDGVLTMNFGPLGKEGGERRLNVAVTRAREQLVIFSSIDPDQIREDVSAPGVRHLAELLAYAKAGGQAGGRAEAHPPATPLTAAIGAALAAKGWTVHHQVGCAGYRLDLAIVDPDEPGRYVLAIETDGPAYASARVARDRDRLRALVLGSLGWRLHRIWSLDWWHEGEKELQRAHNAVINAIAKARAGRKPA